MQRPGFSSAMLHPRFWLLWMGMGLLWLLVQLPYPAILSVGRLVGRAMYHLMPERRLIAATNLELCFPDWTAERREQVLRENFASNGIALFEMAMAWWWPPRRLAKLASIEGLEHLQNAAAQGQGVLLMSLHFTTLEIGAALLGQQATIDGMYREHANPTFDFIQRRGRERHNADALAIEREDVRSMLKSMRSGRAIWYAPDQDYGRKASVFVPFFGVQAATVTATATFARLGKAEVIPFTQTRLPNARGYRLTVHPPLEGFPVGDEEADALRINQWVEQAILEQPEQYMWVHRRFKTRPEGEERPYPKRQRRKRRRTARSG
ncbi:lipid A biosynthesis lauroyl acyltransferase [Pseudomonas sp. gcc21]|uniref:lipid A biosynthesis lauroyl acyltransferase n=1 Tax=Pseudomonas sp. gcc21 TaxID=2726989 RepID=UPI001451C7FD|nr:lipid A biosynthesis lauroyl acyltransferase [Pseudomonas sp. gcc21]QJD57641.1 lipid A biosynthesis lauroyl acyltransferase [Pseudomonas sp. gcc21]